MHPCEQHSRLRQPHRSDWMAGDKGESGTWNPGGSRGMGQEGPFQCGVLV